MKSVHDNGAEDRVWAFYCCRMPGKSLTQCTLTDWTNNYDGYQNYHVPNGYAMYGVYSVHSNYYEDRRFRYRICTVGGK
ncbi:hemagglutinin/amebocyte aggregation factor-like [Dreissena polymorpha]|nr:hemagglutinin/amebocyte aggregation factor-like [Dreissena polymorpha]